MSKTAEKNKPGLWQRIKNAIMRGARGGKPGQWSARKAQLATSEYQKQGGGYEGKKDADNHLQQWQDEDWGTKSGKESLETGERYLPKEAREALSEAEYERTSTKKREDLEKGEQHSAQPEEIAEKTASARKSSSKPAPAKKAAAKSKPATASASRGKAPAKARTAAPKSASGKAERSKAELLEEARRRDIAGRSSMTKAELERALRPN